jgi:Signal peptidase, peptidase S26
VLRRGLQVDLTSWAQPWPNIRNRSEGARLPRCASRNGVREPDPYTRPCGVAPDCDFPVPITIPPGEWFVLGDNRGESDDSRFWGPVPAAWIVGEAHACQRVGIACVASE